MSETSRIPLVGVVCVALFAIPWIVLAVLYAPVDSSLFQFLALLAIATGGLATSFHLWSRIPKFPPDLNLRTLYKLMGFTFIPILLIFAYQLTDQVLRWQGLATISEQINSIAPDVQFDLFYVEEFHTRVPVDSLIVFALIIIGISFYIWPMERFVKQQFPWHTVSMLAVAPLLPLMIVLRDAPLALSIATTVGVVWLVYNFIFLFYLYFKVAIQSTGVMRKGGILIAFGLILFILTWISGWAVGALNDIPNWGENLIQLGLGVGALGLFNAGFWIMRPRE